MIVAEHKSHFDLTKDTPCFTLTGELWGVCYEEFGENWPRYNDTALYLCTDPKLGHHCAYSYPSTKLEHAISRHHADNQTFYNVFWILKNSNSFSLVRCTIQNGRRYNATQRATSGENMIGYHGVNGFSDQWTLLLTWLNFKTAWIGNYIHYEEWGEITYPSPNFNGCTVELWE